MLGALHRFSAAFAIVLGLSVLAPLSAAEPDKATAKDQEYYELMKKFVDAFEQIERNYVKEVDRKQLLDAAIKGMLTDLDQYSNYISPEEIERFTRSVEQEFGGIGIQVNIDPRTKRLTVVSPLPGTPAYAAGVLAGDTIMEIEGKSTEGFEIEDAVKLLKGQPGEKVTIGVRHVGEKDTETLEVERAVIQIASVLGYSYEPDGTWNYMYDDKEKIGYIRISSFSRRTSAELREVLDALKADGMRALVLDLRFNPGGLLSQAITISDMFVEPGKVEDDLIVSTQGREEKGKPAVIRKWRSTKAGTYSGFPIAVLVNHYSASASEIVSACLQDYGRAKIVGQRTWGKGSVQNVIEIGGGSSALKLTTAGYHRPSGKNIHRSKDDKETDEWGVKPDEGFEVKFDEKQMKAYLRERHARDVIKKDGPAKPKFEDAQLNKALEYLRNELGEEAAPKAA